MAHLSYDELGSALSFVSLTPLPELKASSLSAASAPVAKVSEKKPKPPAAAPCVEAKPKSGGAPATSSKTQVARDDTGPLPVLAGNKNFDGCEKRGKYYITTAISYSNGMPHIGHAYESLTMDVIARWHRIFGRRVFAMTGTDEHGQKIANGAEALGVQPIDICDKYASEFIKLNRRMLVSNDRFIRTTEKEHHKVCQELWKRCAANGDIYLDTYKGWYLEREEMFVSAKDAEEWGYKDPSSGVPLKEMEEQSYFFKLAKYREPLLALMEAHPEICAPEDRRQQVISMIKDENQGDLSISRTSFKWGIPVPEGFDQRHVMYVWFDALTNYLSGVEGLNPENPNADFWPADAHIIGKDIIRFHCIYWPAMLLSAGIPLPKAIFSHGFINAADGRKMSKSFGNVIDPHDILDRYPTDTLRFYLCSEAPYGSDVKFSEESMVRMHNGPLADTLGNLVHRGTNLCKKYCDLKIPDRSQGGLRVAYDSLKPEAPLKVSELIKMMDEKFKAFDVQGARDVAMEAARNCNNWLAKLEPWKMKEDQNDMRVAIVLMTLECLFVLAHTLAPFLPCAVTEIFKRLGFGNKPIGCPASELKDDLQNLPEGNVITVGEPLFAKLSESGDVASVEDIRGGKSKSANAEAVLLAKQAKEAKKKALREQQQLKEKEKEMKAAAATAGGGAAAASTTNGAGGGDASQPKKKKDKKEKPSPASKEAAGADSDLPDVCGLDIRVGKILKAWEHPESDKLWCESIDIGEDKPRNICSGLRAFYATAEEITGRDVLVVANLKARKMAGFSSEGMVLCASSPDHTVVKLVEVPPGSKPGDSVSFEGLPSMQPLSANQITKKKVAEKVIFGGELTTVNGETHLAHCTYKGVNKMQVEGVGYCSAPVPEGFNVA